jgi:hypothetical protein
MRGLFSGWSRTSQVAALGAGALMCLLLGTLAGVAAAGGHPQNVLSVFTDPVVPADANSHRPAAKRSAITETVTVPASSHDGGGSRPASTVTVTEPATTVTDTVTETVTDTVTETVTETAPATTQAASSP